MTRQTTSPLVHHSLHASQRVAREIANMVIEGLLGPVAVPQRSLRG